MVRSMAVYNPLYMQYLMDKYGAAWFKMDETSGNVTDSKGNAVGTINGGVTRVAGWNGSGNALSFNGSNGYVQFNSRVIPVGKKSIRFKLKTSVIPTNYIMLLDTNNWMQGSLGWSVYINSSGRIVLTRTSGTNGVGNPISIGLAMNVCDGQWHDILFTWDGTTSKDGLKSFIDDMSIPHATAQANATDAQSAYNLRLGYAANGNSSVGYFNGIIDNLEIYNDVINPIAEKFLLSANKRIYSTIQTSNESKNLLVNMSNCTEIDFINHGVDKISFVSLLGERKIERSETGLGSGKVFGHTIDMSKRRVDKINLN